MQTLSAADTLRAAMERRAPLRPILEAFLPLTELRASVPAPLLDAVEQSGFRLPAWDDARGVSGEPLLHGAVPEAFAALAEPLAVTIHNLIQIFRPEKVVLAGDLMISRDKFVPGLERAFARISPHPFAAVEIISDARGAMRGAALIAAENAIENIDIYRFLSENTGGDPT